MAGKLDSRQKMINMMYLVFIAMLALNIGKEVLATLGVLNDDLESSITELEVSSTASYSQIETNSEKLDYKIAASKVVEMKAEADNFFNYIQVIKDSLLIGENGENKYLKQIQNKETGEEITRMAYQEMDKSQVLDDYFFEGEFLTANGEQYVSNYKSFPTKLSQILDDIVFLEEESKIARTALDGSKGEDGVEIQYDFESAKFDLKNRFSYSDQIVNSEGTTQGFLEYNFYGFPVIASLAKLTKVQSDIRYIENKILNEILSSIQGKGLNFSTFQTLLETTKPVYYTTDVVDAAIVMGKKDEGFKPDKVELFINGKPLSDSEYFIENGKVVLKKRIGTPGTYDLTGTLSKRNADTQELVSIPVTQKLVIIREPNSAVVSADNMKVFYRGLRNPTSISIPGVASNTIVPSSANAKFSKTKNGWAAQPTNAKAKEMKVSVSGVLNGKRKQFDGGTFRILPPPPGKGSVSGMNKVIQTGGSISKTLLANGIVTGTKPKTFLYDYEIIVTGFDIKVGNSPAKKVTGNKASRSSKAALDIKSAGKGTVVVISNIQASSKDGDTVTPNYEVESFFLTVN
jgi:gliding motility-associated protein GldM|tara:strand:+ start:5919 stop:7640 length:1722 start_codon:yes stop_codon:yes gene_type:complete